MNIIGHDDYWALVCPNCRAIIQYEPKEIETRKIPTKQVPGGYYQSDGLECPECGTFISEKKNKKRVIPSTLLDGNSYYAAAINDEVVVV